MSPELAQAWSDAWLLIAVCGGHHNRPRVQAALDHLIEIAAKENAK
jgi:hypothetical protein